MKFTDLTVDFDIKCPIRLFPLPSILNCLKRLKNMDVCPYTLSACWMDEWIDDFTSFTTVFQSYQDDWMVIMKG